MINKTFFKKSIVIGLVGVMMAGCLLSGCGKKKPNSQTQSQVSTEKESSSVEPKTEKATEYKRIVENVEFELVYEGAMELGVIKAYDKSSKLIWEKKTDKHDIAQTDQVAGVGIWENVYYYIDSNKLICVDINTGAEKWRNTDINGGVSNLIDGEGYVFLCANINPQLFVVSPAGKTIFSKTWTDVNVTFPTIAFEGDSLIMKSGAIGKMTESVIVDLAEIKKNK